MPTHPNQIDNTLWLEYSSTKAKVQIEKVGQTFRVYFWVRTGAFSWMLKDYSKKPVSRRTAEQHYKTYVDFIQRYY